MSSYRDSRELLVNLTLRELRSKYKRSFLGWAWSLVTPLATMAVYSIVFSLFFRAKLDPGVHGLHYFSLWLMCALLPWSFFSTGMMSSIGSLVGNASLISKSYFDRRLLPASAVSAALVSHLIEMGLLVVVLAGFGDWQAVAFVPVVVVLIAITALAAFGMGLLLSALNVYFRDIEHFMSIALMVWMYLTPIIYPIKLARQYAKYVKLNPMTEMANCFRSVLYYGRFPTAVDIGYFAGFAAVALAVGWTVFNRLQPGFAEEL
ncbi:MAG TPA: ABC transporter permease [Acidimicrobiales bacterium]|nr:ABC transporter permease [Acidimicrobiales bacterium]